MNKRLASLSLDLDNLWSYMKTHGDPGWEAFPSYLDLVVPRFLGMLRRRGITITVFVVGQDAALTKNHAALRSIAAAGHEIGNHSFNHEPWLHLYSRDELETEFDRAETAIEAATGVRPSAFRGPGYSLSETVLRLLHERGYRYDCSTFPTFVGPLARAYYFLRSRLDRGEKEKRKILFGGLRDGLRPLKPYRWRLGRDGLVEIPVTTMPVIRMPIHFSYLHWLAGFSERLAERYFALALRMCDLAGVQPSLLLHPLDFLGGDDVAGLGFFPAMAQTGTDKMNRMDRLLTMLEQRYQVLPMGIHAERLEASGPLRQRALDFPVADSTGAGPAQPGTERP